MTERVASVGGGSAAPIGDFMEEFIEDLKLIFILAIIKWARIQLQPAGQRLPDIVLAMKLTVHCSQKML
jgi:hypothetical protein